MKKIDVLTSIFFVLALNIQAGVRSPNSDLYQAVSRLDVPAVRNALKVDGVTPNALFDGQPLLIVALKAHPFSEFPITPGSQTVQVIRALKADSRTNIDTLNEAGETAYQFALEKAQSYQKWGDSNHRKVYEALAAEINPLAGITHAQQ